MLSVYYLIYLTLEKWLNPFSVLLFVMSAFLGWKKAEKGKKVSVDWKIILPGMAAILYAGIVPWAYTGNINEPGVLGIGLQGSYYIGLCLLGVSIGSNIVKRSVQEKAVTGENGFWKKIKVGVLLLYVAGLVPLALISPYVFPKADDFSFGYHAHQAWEKTGSLWEVIKAAFVMIEEAWFDWQGTYSSIFFMAIQPAVFDEKLYVIVPFLFVGITTIASYFFMKTILIDWLKADKVLSQICIWSYLLFVVQMVPDSQSAFIWYNGATHYIASHCALLCAIAFVIRGTFVSGESKHSVFHKKGGFYPAGSKAWIGAVIFAVYVGGGNYVTAVGALLLVLTVLAVVMLTGSWKKYKGMIGICIVYLVALAGNFIAPGNFTRKGRFEGYSLVNAFILAFVESMKHMLGEWMHWTIVFFILFLIPVLWRIAAKIKYDFRFPLIAVGYSWCYMASLFFAPLFTLGEVNVGRFQNVMFLEWILLLIFDLTYVMGWLQRKSATVRFLDEPLRKYNIPAVEMPGRFEKRFITAVFCLAVICFGLGSKAEPQKYTSLYALQTLTDLQLETYAGEYWDMVEILNREDEIVEIKDFSYIPPYFDVSLRNEGLRLFYNKKEVVIK